MGASKPTTALASSPSTSAHAHLKPTTKHISRTTILKKWKPLPATSQQKVREILSNLKTKRAGAGHTRIPAIGAKKRNANEVPKVTKSAIVEAEYEKVVEEVAEKLLSRLPRMPFPPSSSSNNTTSTTAPNDFDLSSTLARTRTLQTQLSTNTHSARLLRRQIQREKAALKKDRKELKMLEEGLRGSREVRKRKERGLHPIARLDGGDGDDNEGSDEENEEDREEKATRRAKEIARVNAIAGITTSGSSNPATVHPPVTMTSHSDLDPESEADAMLDPLLAQLRSHLLSMRNNTASMEPVLTAMDETRTALEKFSARTMDDEALRRLYGAADV